MEVFWRDTGRPARFFIIDARAVFPFLGFILHISWWTFFVALAASIFFGLLERYRFTLPVFLRWIRTTLAGPHKISAPWWRDGKPWKL